MPSYWFSLEGMRELDAVHNYMDSLPETGKVLSLSTVFAVVKNLLGDDIGGVELAIVQKSLPDDIKEMMVSPYFSERRSRPGLRCGSRRPARTCAATSSCATATAPGGRLGFAPEQVQFTGMLVLYNNVLQSLFRSQILTLGVVFWRYC